MADEAAVSSRVILGRHSVVETGTDDGIQSEAHRSVGDVDIG